MHKRGEFLKILSAALISQSGSHFLTLALSAMVFLKTGSAVKGSLIFVLSFLPSVFVSSHVGAWIDRALSRKLLAVNEAASIVTSVLCGACLYYNLPIAILCAVVALRSLLLFISRTAMTKWVKIISPDLIQAPRIKLFFLSFFLSTAIAGSLAGLFLGKISIWPVIGVDVLTYCLGLLVIFSLKEVEHHTWISSSNPKSVHVISSILHIFGTSSLKTSFIAVCLSQAIFQGAYSILVSYLPIHHFDLGLGGTGIFQLGASVGIICGFLVNWRFPTFLNTNGSLPLRLVTFIAIGIGGLLLATQMPLNASVLSFFIMNFAYECIWLFHSTEFFKQSPLSSAARYQFTLSSSAAFIMALTTLAYAWAIDQFGLETGVTLVLSIGLLGWISVSWFPSKQSAHGLEVRT